MQWSDTLKIFVPLVGSLLSAMLLIWAQYKFTRYREFKNKSEYLWRTITNRMNGYSESFAALDEIRDNAKKSRFRVRVFYTPPVDMDIAYRLAEIDPKYAYLYADFAAHQEIVRISLEYISDLMQKLSVMPTNEQPTELGWLMKQHVRAAKINLATWAHKSLDLMERIQKKDFFKKRDPQHIAALEEVIENLQVPT